MTGVLPRDRKPLPSPEGEPLPRAAGEPHPRAAGEPHPRAAGEPLPRATGATPAIAQWFAAKAAHPDALIFFRMGDFFEMLFEDAEIAAPALDIALSTRGEHQGRKVPLCGVPAHAYEVYLARLIRQGHRVAICDQTETPEETEAPQGPDHPAGGGAPRHPRHGDRGGAAGSRPPAWLLALARGTASARPGST